MSELANRNFSALQSTEINSNSKSGRYQPLGDIVVGVD